MKRDKVWRDFSSLPPELQKQVADFIAFLRTRYTADDSNKAKRTKLSREPFVGMWRDRDDMVDSSAWVRRFRQGEWL